MWRFAYPDYPKSYASRDKTPWYSYPSWTGYREGVRRWDILWSTWNESAISLSISKYQMMDLGNG
jgi:hypothetical protein